MSRIAAPFTALTLALALSTIGCGGAGKEKTDPGTATGELNEYLPLEVGNTWRYRVTDDNGNSIDKTTVVLEEQLVGGSGPNKDTMAFFVRTTKTGSTTEDKTESWQGTIEVAEGQYATVRYREISYHAMDGTKELEEHWNPYKYRADNFHVAGDEWTQTYTETKLYEDPAKVDEIDGDRYDVWTVQSDEASITVPAGAFVARQFMRQATDPSDPSKVYWFVPGIGKVQETGSQTEMLVDCEIGGRTCAEIVESL